MMMSSDANNITGTILYVFSRVQTKIWFRIPSKPAAVNADDDSDGKFMG